jgi:branched-chain amino acid aminotransferase/4-amino-4-deoxychorismate lyase
LAYGDQLLARQEALAAGASEAILLDTQARVSCTSVGNLFVEYKGYWCTPALNCGVLPGVARAHILNQLQAQEMVLRESDLAHVSRAFISNSLGLTPVTRIQGLELCRDLPPEVRSSGRSLFA